MTRPAPLAVLDADLPPAAQDLVRWMGWRGAIAIIRAMPGARIYSPINGPQYSRTSDARYAQIAELAGERATRKFYEEIMGTFFDVPTCRYALTRARSRALRQAFDGGASVEQLCAAFGLGRRRVHYILKQADTAEPGAPLRRAEASGQMGLF